MRKNSIAKRLVSFVLAFSLAFSGINFAGVVDAVDYYIRFKDTTTNITTTNSILVEGNPVRIEASLPPSYEFSTIPFAARQTVGGVSIPIPDISTVFQIVTNVIGKTYSLTPLAGSAGGSSSEYTLEALYTANITEGSVSIAAADGNFAFDVTADAAIPITADSSLSFKVRTDQAATDTSISFDTVETATGYFAGKYEGQAVSANAITGTGGNRVIPVIINSGSTSDPRTLKFNISLSGLPANYLFKAGTKFTVTFTRQTISPLIATVITPQKAVDDTKDSVLQNTTDTGVTTTGEAYIQLNGDDTLQSIEDSFVVLSNVHRYNIDVDLTWSWTAQNPNYQSYVQVQRTSNAKKQAITIVNRPVEDMPGTLSVTASFSYTPSGTSAPITVTSPVGEIPIIIYGTGNPPRLDPLQSYTGVQGGSDTVTTMTSFPQTVSMDVYTGNPAYAAGSTITAPRGAYKISASIFFGNGRGQANRAIIRQNSAGGEVDVFVEGSAVAYSFGSDITNTGNYKAIDIVAKTRGQTQLTVEFYNNSNELMSSYTVRQNFYIEDTTPSGDGTLARLVLKGKDITSGKETAFTGTYPNSVIDFGFDSAVNAYNLTLPNCVESVTFTPTLTTGSGASTTIAIDLPTQSTTVQNGNESIPIALEPQIPQLVRITVTAQDGSTNSYTITLTRDMPSSICTLDSLEAYDVQDTSTNLITNFSSQTFTYAITVPYSVTELEVIAEPTSPWVTLTDGSAIVWTGPVRTRSLVQRLLSFFLREQVSTIFTLNRPVAVNGVFPASALTTITATVIAEDGTSRRTYTINVTSLAPNNDSTLKTLSVADENGKVFPYDYVTTFSPDRKNYLVHIPYSTATINITAQANDDVSSKELELAQRTTTYSYTRSPAVYNPGIPSIFTVRNMSPVAFTGETDPNMTPFTFTFTVTAESENRTDPPYTIEFQRNDPDDDSSLMSLTLTDQDGGAINFPFNTERLEYDEIDVPYLTSKIIVTPVTRSSLATVKVNDADITAARPSYTTPTLPVNQPYTITVQVTAEDFSVRTYTIPVRRARPSDEARLSSLVLESLTLEPKFNPNTLKYKVTIPEGTSGYTVTPTAVSPYATITVNNEPVASGSTSTRIVPTNDETKCLVIVTAQDGRTTRTYTITVTDENLIEKSDNADLYSLRFVTADMAPAFRSSITEYEVYMKDEDHSVVIIPEKANRYATIKVYNGSLEIGDHNDEYAISLFEDETEISIEVTSQDGSVKKTYYATIYRENEDKQGHYKPLVADDVNFTVEDPIKIDITKYPIIQADVFNTLKLNFPEKSILFEGNDYTLSIKGSDIDTIIPSTEQYDLSLTFTPPDEDAILDFLGELDSSNESLDPVFIHFNHHGALPADMKFTISLGYAYRNRPLYWNYYNEERERIDYYGYVVSNAKGTFALPLAHMSTYIVTDERIIDSENKAGALGGYYSAGADAITDYTTGKANPNTGAEVKR